MPTVAWVAGMAIMFYYDGHDPPHFHVRGNGLSARVSVADGSLIEATGRITAHEARILRAWTIPRRSELIDNWRRARDARPLRKIEGTP